MKDVQYLVIKRGGEWWVTLDGSRTGPYATETEAVDWAVATAKLYEKSGRTAEVAVDETSAAQIVLPRYSSSMV